MENKKSSFSVIPSYILCDEDLEHGAVRLYGMISMYSEEGRCWASNQHFADKFKVSIRTIQNWLQQLTDKEYIEVEIIKGGFQTKRNIWITNDFKKHSTKRNTFHPDAQCISPTHETDFTSYNGISTSDTNIKQQQQKSTANLQNPKVDSAAALSSKDQKCNESNNESHDLSVINAKYPEFSLFGISKETSLYVYYHHTDEEISRALAWLNKNSAKVTTTNDQALTWACKTQPSIEPNKQEKQQQQQQKQNHDHEVKISRKQFSEEIRKYCWDFLKSNNLDVHNCPFVTNDYIEFRGKIPEKVYYSDSGYKNIVESQLRKQNIPIPIWIKDIS